MLRVQIISPQTDAPGSGNATTALRWARCLRALGHRVRTAAHFDGRTADVMVALHAHKSATSIQRFHKLYPGLPLIVALTGTDVYRDLARSARARRSLEQATRLIVLQRLALDELEPRHRRKAVVIEQSVRAPNARERATQRRVASASSMSSMSRGTASTSRSSSLQVVVLANLRYVKDPLRAAMAARCLPPTSRILVRHAGAALSPAYRQRARRETRNNPRYTWLGPVSSQRARSLLLQSAALILSSRLEGGANVVSEAIVCGVPVLASEIPGSVGLLGSRYPGYFPVGDTRALASLLERFENDPRFGDTLRRHVRMLAPRFSPARERAAWKKLLRAL